MGGNLVGQQPKAKPKRQLIFENLGEKMKMKSCVDSASEYAIFIQVIREWITAGKVDKIPILPPPPNQPAKIAFSSSGLNSDIFHIQEVNCFRLKIEGDCPIMRQSPG